MKTVFQSVHSDINSDNDEVLAWLSLWSELKMLLHIAQLMPLPPPSSLASLKSSLV